MMYKCAHTLSSFSQWADSVCHRQRQMAHLTVRFENTARLLIGRSLKCSLRQLANMNRRKTTNTSEPPVFGLFEVDDHIKYIFRLNERRVILENSHLKLTKCELIPPFVAKCV